MDVIADCIARCCKDTFEQEADTIRSTVEALIAKYPLYE